jgi:hypothetical protein
MFYQFCFGCSDLRAISVYGPKAFLDLALQKGQDLPFTLCPSLELVRNCFDPKLIGDQELPGAALLTSRIMQKDSGTNLICTIFYIIWRLCQQAGTG